MADGKAMRRDELAVWIDYNYWATHRVLDAAARVSQAEFIADGRG